MWDKIVRHKKQMQLDLTFNQEKVVHEYHLKQEKGRKSCINQWSNDSKINWRIPNKSIYLFGI